MNQWIKFPDPNLADDFGLVCQGGELTPIYLLSAYQQGLFPWFNDDDPVLWWSPNPRMVLYPEKYKLTKSMRQLIGRNTFELRIDTNFPFVIKACASIPRFGQDGTWLTEEMIDAYITLHNMGFVHSFETYFEDKLVGGLYGVSLGNAFFGESMFYEMSNASKFAFYHLVQFSKQNNFRFIDAQQSTRHLESMGAEEIPRALFLNELNSALSSPTLQKKWTDTYTIK